jgi:hypothetical protein
MRKLFEAVLYNTNNHIKLQKFIIDKNSKF